MVLLLIFALYLDNRSYFEIKYQLGSSIVSPLTYRVIRSLGLLYWSGVAHYLIELL